MVAVLTSNDVVLSIIVLENSRIPECLVLCATLQKRLPKRIRPWSRRRGCSNYCNFARTDTHVEIVIPVLESSIGGPAFLLILGR